LSGEQFSQFTSIDCSYFSQTSGKAPALNDIKNYARAPAKLIEILDACDIAGIGPIDWLSNLDVPHSDSAWSHSKPLNALVNTIAVVNGGVLGSRKITAGCTLDERNAHSWRLAGHANGVFQRPDAVPEREKASKGVLG